MCAGISNKTISWDPKNILTLFVDIRSSRHSNSTYANQVVKLPPIMYFHDKCYEYQISFPCDMVLGSTHLPNEYYSKLNLCMCSPKIIHTDSMNYVCRNYVVQVNQCQKHSFLNQLTHNMTRDCSLNSPKNTSSELVVYKYCLECQNKNIIFVHNMF